MNQTQTELMHFGVIGMKWGKHKTLTGFVISKKGESVELHKMPTSSTAKFLSKLIPSIAKNIEAYSDYTIRDKSGKSVGTMSVNRDSKTELNLVWISVNNKSGGLGYGQSAMRTIIDDAKKNGVKTLTLEVPTTSPNARHIYEKQGFKSTGEKMLGDENDFWGGLTKMKLDLR